MNRHRQLAASLFTLMSCGAAFAADNAGNTITYTLDGLGNRIQEDTKDPSGVLKRKLSRTYDTLGQMTALKNAGFKFDAPDPTAPGASTIARKA